MAGRRPKGTRRHVGPQLEDGRFYTPVARATIAWGGGHKVAEKRKRAARAQAASEPRDSKGRFKKGAGGAKKSSAKRSSKKAYSYAEGSSTQIRKHDGGLTRRAKKHAAKRARLNRAPKLKVGGTKKRVYKSKKKGTAYEVTIKRLK